MAKQFRCRVCGHASGSDIYCGARCKAKLEKDHADHAVFLTEQGFKQHPEAKNLYVKDGAAVALEEVQHHGREKALERHTSAAAERAHDRNTHGPAEGEGQTDRGPA